MRDDLTIDVSALERRIEEDRREGHRPFLLVGNAGTVSTGAVDPLARLATIARKHDLWLHADGAYGAPAVVSAEAPAELAGLAEADSVAFDPHKWLYSPLEAGCALVRHPGALRDAFSYSPPYYRFDGEAEDPRTNYSELGIQNSRGFRALKVWLGLMSITTFRYVPELRSSPRTSSRGRRRRTSTSTRSTKSCSTA